MNVVEIGFLLLASLYAFAIIIKNRIDLWDTIVLVGVFGAYLWQTGRMPKVDAGLEEVEAAFERMHGGDVLRSVVVL